MKIKLHILFIFLVLIYIYNKPIYSETYNIEYSDTQISSSEIILSDNLKIINYYLENHQLHFPFDNIVLKTKLNIFEYYLLYLDKASNILRESGLSNLKIHRKGNLYLFDDPSGLNARFKLVKDNEKKIYYGKGRYKSIFEAEGILVLSYDYDIEKNIVINKVNVYIDVDNRFIYWMTRLFHSYVMNILNNYAEKYIETAQKFFDSQN